MSYSLIGIQIHSLKHIFIIVVGMTLFTVKIKTIFYMEYTIGSGVAVVRVLTITAKALIT